MRIFLIVFIFSISSFSAKAQYLVEGACNLNEPLNGFGKNYNTGIGVFLEPKHIISDQVDVGLYLGIDLFGASDKRIKYGKPDFVSIVPIMISGTYQFGTKKLKPYAGLAVGVFSVSQIHFFESLFQSEDKIRTTNFSELGFSPRVGLYYKYLNFRITYSKSESFENIQFSLGFRAPFKI